ncbi:hypothetical protein [Acinetobacter ursingii]|uniref:hypothetical protein n=1 Tax=Acinetobacter ursingii TaxID=108980 RepID=UPI0005CA67BE|nr:hypothetical protein [Acinetobacter ursingii]
MSEKSIDKTKRNLIDKMDKYHWGFQYGLFVALDGEDKAYDINVAEKLILSGLENFREKLRKGFLDTGILLMIRKRTLPEKFKVNYRKDFQQIYITWYSSKEMSKDKIKKIAESVYGENATNLLDKELTEEKIKDTIYQIKRKNLHNLTKYFEINGKKFDRFTCLNFKKFIILN